MNAGVAAGERAREVRVAARAWEKAGWIDGEKRSAIDKLHADDRVRLGWALRGLVCLFTWFALSSGFGFLMTIVNGFRENIIGLPLVVLGIFCLVGAEVAHLALRTSGMGADDALEIAAVACVWAGTAILFDWDHAYAMVSVFFFGTLLLALAAWRWGGWFFGGLATAGVFATLARLPAPRLLWCLAGALLVPALLWLGDRRRLAPSQRAGARTGVVIALGALYVALNYLSVERGVFEAAWLDGGDGSTGAPAALLLPIGLLATALLPLLVLTVGIRRRDRLVLGCGILLAAASLVTLRWYVHLMPLWTLLLLVGVALGGAALALRRWLDGGAAHERGGFTAEPLLEGGRRQLVEMAAAVAAFSPAARVHPDAPAPGFEGGGGQSGGGGATTDF
jgi:hypothetical protein